MRPPTGLTAAARAAYSRAERELGDDATRFRTALLSYTYAVDLESRARAEWEAESRPLIQVHGAAGVHPLAKLVMETARAAAWHGAQLGMDPASAKRINPHRRPGRPVGSNSAPDSHGAAAADPVERSAGHVLVSGGRRVPAWAAMLTSRRSIGGAAT